MSEQYIAERKQNSAEPSWENIKSAVIGCYPWDSNGYMPWAEAKACYDDNAIYVRLCAIEDEITAKYKSMNDPVCKDSCLECFLQPDPSNDERYINFEFNSIGTMLSEIGRGRQGRSYLNSDVPDIIKNRAFVAKESGKVRWGVEFHIPSGFLKSFFPDFELKKDHFMRGNFYKCGEDVKYPHFGCWNKVDTAEADFHRPEFFGSIILG